MRTTLSSLYKMMREGRKITMLTCYDASFAALLDGAGLDTLLIGDSLGNVLQGHESTLPVSLRDMVYHTACVARGAKNALIIGDMPFGTFQVSPQDAFCNAAEIMAAGAQMVKIEGGQPMLETISWPRPGLVWGEARRRAAEPRGAVHFAHSDQSVMVLFEVAQYRGVLAVERILRDLGKPFASSLGPLAERA